MALVQKVLTRYLQRVTPERTYDLLDRLSTLLGAEERRAGTAHGLQPVQTRALAYLERCNRYSDNPAAVAEYLGLTKGTASQTLQRLEEKGLVMRRADRRDGRKVHLRPTSKGRRVLDDVRPPAVLARALERSPASLGTALEALLRSLQAANGSRSFGVCRTCRHFRPGKGTEHQCGLTLEPLRDEETGRICREHEARK